MLRLQKTEKKGLCALLVSSKMTWNGIYNFIPENEWGIIHNNQNKHDTYQDYLHCN